MFSYLLSRAAGCIMFLVLAQAMEYTPSLLLNPVLLMMEKNGLLHGVDTKFVTWFYTMHRVLRMKLAFKATTHNPSFASLLKNDQVAAAVNDIKDEVFWKVICCLLCALFHALKASRYCDSNIPATNKFFSWCSKRMKHCMTRSCFLMIKTFLGLLEEWPYQTARKKWKKFLDKQYRKNWWDTKVWMIFWIKLKFLSFHFSDNDNDNNITLGDAVLFAWNKRENRSEHAYVVTALALSLQLDIRVDCMERRP